MERRKPPHRDFEPRQKADVYALAERIHKRKKTRIIATGEHPLTLGGGSTHFLVRFTHYSGDFPADHEKAEMALVGVVNGMRIERGSIMVGASGEPVTTYSHPDTQLLAAIVNGSVKFQDEPTPKKQAAIVYLGTKRNTDRHAREPEALSPLISAERVMEMIASRADQKTTQESVWKDRNTHQYTYGLQTQSTPDGKEKTLTVTRKTRAKKTDPPVNTYETWTFNTAGLLVSFDCVNEIIEARLFKMSVSQRAQFWINHRLVQAAIKTRQNEHAKNHIDALTLLQDLAA